MSHTRLSFRKRVSQSRPLLFTVLLATCGLTGCFNRPPAHGTALLVEADLSSLRSESERQRAMASVREVLSQRAYKFGASYSTEPSGTNGVWVKVGTSTEPALSDLKGLLVLGGSMEFHLVLPENQAFMSSQQPVPGYEPLSHKITGPGGREFPESLLVSTPSLLSGGIKSATVMRGAADQMEIGFKFHPEAAKQFAQITRTNVGRRLAILLDGQLQTAPVIQSPIEGGAGVISGNFTPKEAFKLACALETPLPVPVKIVLTRPF